MNFAPPEAIGWAAFAITVVYAAVMYGVGRFRGTPFWKTRLISVPVELLGYFVFGWAIGGTRQLAVIVSITCTALLELYVATFPLTRNRNRKPNQ